MPEITRTLVKSAPELWAEISDAEALGRHLEAFGSVAITATDPEQCLAWEGELATGTIRLEPSGFGTKVALATELKLAEPPAPEPLAVAPEPEPVAPEPAAIEAEKRGFFARLFRRKPPAVTPAPAPEPAAAEPAAPEPAPEPSPPPAPEPLIAEPDAEAALSAMLDALGTARHRPFSRA